MGLGFRDIMLEGGLGCRLRGLWCRKESLGVNRASLIGVFTELSKLDTDSSTKNTVCVIPLTLERGLGLRDP